MPISVTCPECNSTYRVADEAAGKAIKCKKCGARVPVPAAGDEDLSAPAAGGAANGEGEGGEARPNKKGGSGKVIAIVAGALVGACCLCTGVGGVVTWWAVGKAKEGAKDFANQFNKGFEEAMKKAQKDKVVVAGGATILEKRETLTDKDPKIANGKSAKAYKVTLQAGKRYVIDMKAAKQFGGDPYLYLLDSKGKELAHDDDSGGFPDAQIRFTPPATAEYTIQASSLGGPPPGGLAFVLTVKLE